jgi:ABC-2 type transport system ATP-binding protein
MSEGTAAVEAAELSMGYGRDRESVLRHCSFRLPAGRICALVGPNGVGKTTLLALLAGLLRPASGTVRMLGEAPGGAVRERFAYVAQTRPMYPQLTVAEMLRYGAELNPGRWDQDAAERIVYEDGPSPRARIRTLSGGERTRVALALALGKRPEVLLLDEPLADLDPLARHRVTGVLMAEAAEHGTTIVMSSHVISELESVCDYLLLLGSGRIRIAGDCGEVLAAHRQLTGTGEDFGPHTVVEETATGRGRTALVRPHGDIDTDTWAVEEPSLEELLLAYLRRPEASDFRASNATSIAGQEAAA